MVDDEHALRRLLRLYLERESYTVLEADNGLDALSVLRRGGIDVALIDVMLPELDGFEVVRRIRVESSVPIILLTARGEETNRVAGLELGADDYVVKPFSAPEVVARVRAQLRARTVSGPSPVGYVTGA
ncbi:MAG: response regulator transcription factor [Solirubrobacteraceae bacterium]